MTVRLSSEVEQEELENRKKARGNTSWEFYRSASLVEIVHKARDLGWAEKKVQVRREIVADDALEFIIEPYEGQFCNCPGILKYDDFFL